MYGRSKYHPLVFACLLIPCLGCKKINIPQTISKVSHSSFPRARVFLPSLYLNALLITGDQINTSSTLTIWQRRPRTLCRYLLGSIPKTSALLLFS